MWADDQLKLLLTAIATSLRNQAVMMEAMAVHLGSMGDLRLRVQLTIKLLNEIDAAQLGASLRD
jgi:hypothetical protein